MNFVSSLVKIGFVLFVGVVLGIDLQAASQASFYVSPTGNDAWSGTSAKPNAKTSRGPFATLQRARDAVRQLKANQGGTLTRSVTIYLLDGYHFQTEPFVLTPEDSGTADAPLLFVAAKKARPVISGGRRISGWHAATANGHSVWAADVPEAASGQWFFHQLWVNGQRAIRARYPNEGVFKVAALTGTSPQWYIGDKEFVFSPGDIQNWSTVTNAEVVVMNRWVESRLPVVSVDEGSHVVHFSKRSVYELIVNDIYYLEHALEFLDAPGEWYLDRHAGVLYYMPRPGENMESAVVIAPVLPQVVHVAGDSVHGQFVENIQFRGITFAHNEWYFPPEYQPAWTSPDIGGFAQAAADAPALVYAEGARACRWDACSFVNLGTYGVELSQGCQSNRIAACEMNDLGAGGIKIGELVQRTNMAEQVAFNEVSDCQIQNGGRLFQSGVGILMGETHDNLVSHNHIHDFYYTGISVGWTWGYSPTLAYGNHIEWNLIHHLGVLSDGSGPLLSDMGGIYTLGTQPGTIINHNVLHTIAAHDYGGWGIYFDEGSSEIVAEYNHVYGTTDGSVHHHYGKDNVLQNNVFAFGRDNQINRSRQESNTSFIFDHNIVVWSEGQLLGGSWSNNEFAFDHNLYHRTDNTAFTFGGFSYSQWQAMGQDTHSLIEDPNFISLTETSFKLSPNSPAIQLGFEPFDLSGVGPRPKVVSAVSKGK